MLDEQNLVFILKLPSIKCYGIQQAKFGFFKCCQSIPLLSYSEHSSANSVVEEIREIAFQHLGATNWPSFVVWGVCAATCYLLAFLITHVFPAFFLAQKCYREKGRTFTHYLV